VKSARLVNQARSTTGSRVRGFKRFLEWRSERRKQDQPDLFILYERERKVTLMLVCGVVDVQHVEEIEANRWTYWLLFVLLVVVLLLFVETAAQ